MIWFNLRKLESDLVNGKVSDKAAFIYLLAQLGFLCVLIQLPFDESPNWWIWLLLSLAVTVWGVSTIFRINRKGGDRDFLRRFISISFMAVIRCLMLVLFISALEGIFAIAKTSLDFPTFWTAFKGKGLNVLRGFILIFYFIYLIPSFKRLNAADRSGGGVEAV